MADRPSKAREVVDAVRLRALPSTQNRLAALIVAGQVWYRPVSATWFVQADNGADPSATAQRGDGRALRTMRATGLVEVGAERDARGAFRVALTEAGAERYRLR